MARLVPLVIAFRLALEGLPAPASSLPALRVAVGRSRTFAVPGLARAAVADGKIASARAIAPNQLLLTGKRPGITTVRAWEENGHETAIELVVFARDLAGPSGEENGEVVRIALEFLELDGSLSRSLGFRWPEAVQISAAGSVSDHSSGLNYAVSFTSAKSWLQHLVTQGWAKVVANPDLYVRSGEEAVFHSGGELPVATSSENYGRYHKHVEWKPYGLTVRVRPRSPDGYRISSDIQVNISEVNPALAIEGIPALTKRSLQTKMQSVDRETVVLSGLVRQSSASRKAGLPLLGEIPLLGLFFSTSDSSSEETELFMAVTFSFVTPRREIERLERFRERFQGAGE